MARLRAGLIYVSPVYGARAQAALAMAEFFTARLTLYADQLAVQALRGAVLAAVVAAGAAMLRNVTFDLETLVYGRGVRPVWAKALAGPAPPAPAVAPRATPCSACVPKTGGPGM